MGTLILQIETARHIETVQKRLNLQIVRVKDPIYRLGPSLQIGTQSADWVDPVCRLGLLATLEPTYTFHSNIPRRYNLLYIATQGSSLL